MHIAIFGANGATGRLLTRQALDADHRVVAVTRHPQAFPFEHANLRLVEADVHDRAATAAAMAGADVVLSTLGVPFSRKPINIYGDGIRSMAEGMATHGITRVVVVSSSAVEPAHHADGGFLLNRAIQPLITRTIGKSTYADMRAMERFLRSSDLEWTVMRPGGLFNGSEVSEYELNVDHSERVFTSRADLAHSILAQVDDPTWIGKCVAVNTVAGAPTLLQMIRAEAVA